MNALTPIPAPIAPVSSAWLPDRLLAHVPADHPDAALIEAARAYVQLSCEFNATTDVDPDTPEAEALEAEQTRVGKVMISALSDMFSAYRARTPAGMLAWIAVMSVEDPNCDSSWDCSPNLYQLLKRALFDGATLMHPATPLMPAETCIPATALHPDAELLALGAELDRMIGLEQAIQSAAQAMWQKTRTARPAGRPVTPAERKIHGEIESVITRLFSIPAHTQDGTRVKLRASAWYRGNEPYDAEEFCWRREASLETRLMASMLNDLQMQANAAPPRDAAHPVISLSGDGALLLLGHELDAAVATAAEAWQKAEAETEGETQFNAAEKASEAAFAVVARILPVPARTLAGLHVKLKALRWCHTPVKGHFHLSDPEPGPLSIDEQVMISIYEDMDAMADPAALAANPDADLIATCQEHIHNLHVFNRDGGDFMDMNDDPLWLAYERTRDAMRAAQPTTLLGMIAKARSAKAEALGPDGSRDPEDTPAAELAWDLVNDLLRLAPGEAQALDAAVANDFAQAAE